MRSDDQSDYDFNYWLLSKKTSGGFPYYREITSVTLSEPNTDYVTTVCLEGAGEYYFGVYDFEGDGLCYEGRCSRSSTAGYFSVVLDGIEIGEDEPFYYSYELPFNYPSPFCVDLPGDFTGTRANGDVVSDRCKRLERRSCPDDPAKCQRLCDGPLLSGDLVSDVCQATCAEVGKGPCA